LAVSGRQKKLAENNHLFLAARRMTPDRSAADNWPPKMCHDYFWRPHVGRRKLTISEEKKLK
jgi:hypothetical protein